MPTDYGADCSTWAADGTGPDMDPTFTMMDSASTDGPMQGWARRLCLPRGGHVENRNDGFDLRRFCNSRIDRRAIIEIKVGAEREGLKDERIASASCSVSWDARTKTLTVGCSGVTVTGEEFSFVVAADALTTTLVT